MQTGNAKFKIYLLFCIFLFVVLLIVVIYYSLGYKYNPQNGKTIQTGAIIVQTDENNADIYLNGSFFKNTKTINRFFDDYVKIEGLHPAVYNIQIRAGDYFTWEKNIEVKSGYVTEIKNVVLLRNNYTKTALLDKSWTGFAPDKIWINNAKNKIIYGKKDKNRTGLFIFDLESKKESTIIDYSNNPFREIKESYSFDEILWPDSGKIILKIRNNKNFFWYIVDLENNNRVYNLHPFENFDIKKKWNFEFYKNRLFYLKENSLYELDYINSVSKKFLDGVSGFSIDNDHIYYFKPGDKNFYDAKYNDPSDTRNLLLMPDDFDGGDVHKIARSGKNDYFIISGSGKLYFINRNGGVNFINSSVKDAFFSNSSNLIVYYNDHEIWIFYAEEKKSQPSKEKLTNELLTRFSGQVKDIFSYKDEEHLFFKEGDTFKFAELDDRDKRNVFGIFKSDNDDIFYSEKNNSLLYLEGGSLIKIDLGEK